MSGLRTVADRTRSRHDHNVVPGSQSALNVRAHKERLPHAGPITRMVITMPGWDATSTRETLASRAASKARAADYR